MERCWQIPVQIFLPECLGAFKGNRLYTAIIVLLTSQGNDRGRIKVEWQSNEQLAVVGLVIARDAFLIHSELCMCVCMYVCMYACMRICIYIYIHTHVRVGVCVFVCM